MNHKDHNGDKGDKAEVAEEDATADRVSSRPLMTLLRMEPKLSRRRTTLTRPRID